MSNLGEFSSVVASALLGGDQSRKGRRRNTEQNTSFSQPQSFTSAVITPLTILPNAENPMLNDEDEEYVCLDGDEDEQKLYEKFNLTEEQTEESKCVYCKHGMCKHESSSAELDEIHSLEEQHYGTISDKSMFKWISEEYDSRIRTPLVLEQQAKLKRGSTSGVEEIPQWDEENVAKHFERDGMYLHRLLGKDIRVSDLILDQLRFCELAKRKKGEKRKILELEKVKLWKEVSKHKSDLITKMHVLYPNIAKRQKKSDKGMEGAKPPGTR